jgi:hypothetical protein
VLLATGNALAGPSAAALESWSQDTDMCSAWLGIKCNAAGLVTDISLPGKKLAGTLPSGWSALKSLKVIALQQNQLVSVARLDFKVKIMTGSVVGGSFF